MDNCFDEGIVCAICLCYSRVMYWYSTEVISCIQGTSESLGVGRF